MPSLLFNVLLVQSRLRNVPVAGAPRLLARPWCEGYNRRGVHLPMTGRPLPGSPQDHLAQRAGSQATAAPTHSGGNQAGSLEPLKDHWTRAWDLLGLDQPAPAAFADLVRRYREPHRAYHTLRHLEECFARFDEAVGLAERPGELLVGLWFHDAVYDTHAADNELRSAALAKEVISTVGGGEELAARVDGLVLATRHDAQPAGVDQALIADIDLAILAAPAPRFDEYERQVRQEYNWVPESPFRAARIRILTGFLARPTIFSTTHFVDQYESRAQANLRRSLARLAES